jgi:CBS domain containing-hemolysin-like protein
MNAAFLAASGGLEEAPPKLDPWLGLALGLLLVALNGFFVAAEFALVKVRPTQIEPHAARGDPRGRLAQHMLSHLDAYLSASQLGITLASLALGWIGEPAFAWLLRPLLQKIPGATPGMLHSATLTIAFVLITALHIILGEQAPKTLAIRKAEATSLWVSIPMYVFFKVTYPLIWVINKASSGLLRLVGLQPVSEEQLGHSEEELRLLLAGRGAKLSKQKRELLDNIFELSHRTARQVMVPRADVTYLSLSRSMQENLEIARKSEYTRYPLCTEHLDDVNGMVHIKDLFHSGKPPSSLEEIRRDILFVPESLTLDRLLRRMRQERSHMAAVVDEYGGVSGVVTLENVIEEIVGQIQDEFDRERPELVKKGENEYRVAGAMLVADLEDALRVDFSDRDEDTVAGVVLSELGRSPRIGDHVTVGRVEFEVLDAERHRIETLLVKVKPRESRERALD